MQDVKCTTTGCDVCYCNIAIYVNKIKYVGKGRYYIRGVCTK